MPGETPDEDREASGAAASFDIISAHDGSTLALSGDWTLMTLGAQAIDLPAQFSRTRPARIDVSRLGRLDTAGAYAILRAIGKQPAVTDFANRKDAQQLLSMVQRGIYQDAPPQAAANGLYQLLDRMGRGVVSFGHEAWRIAEFIGRLQLALWRTVKSPERLRGTSLVSVMASAGVHALPIICIMNFFVGAVIALVGTTLLTSLGVAVFTVQLVGVAVLREFGIMITAILLAGRSASSFAAQIGSMKMTQEIDAMQVIGVDQFDALVVPRVLALLFIMPLLSFAGMMAGILGGVVVSWATLGISPIFFAQRMHDTVSIDQFWIGLSKAPIFAVLIATAGCRHGLAVGGDVESLGARVTMAVVQAIFMTILFDAIFAVALMKLNL
jgi:phospholipid/cholesterol/gamma-HCH transport system permease protein